MPTPIWGQEHLDLSGMGLNDWGGKLLLQALLYLWFLSLGHCPAGRLWEWEAEGLLHARVVQTSAR